MLQNSLFWTWVRKLYEALSHSFQGSRFRRVLQSISATVSHIWTGSLLYALLSIPLVSLMHSRLYHGFKQLFSSSKPKEKRLGHRTASTSFVQKGTKFWLKNPSSFIVYLSLLSFIWGAGALLRIVLTQAYHSIWLSLSIGLCVVSLILFFLTPHSESIWQGSLLGKILRSIFTLEVNHER